MSFYVILCIHYMLMQCKVFKEEMSYLLTTGAPVAQGLAANIGEVLVWFRIWLATAYIKMSEMQISSWAKITIWASETFDLVSNEIGNVISSIHAVNIHDLVMQNIDLIAGVGALTLTLVLCSFIVNALSSQTSQTSFSAHHHRGRKDQETESGGTVHVSEFVQILSVYGNMSIIDAEVMYEDIKAQVEARGKFKNPWNTFQHSIKGCKMNVSMRSKIYHVMKLDLA